MKRKHNPPTITPQERETILRALHNYRNAEETSIEDLDELENISDSLRESRKNEIRQNIAEINDAIWKIKVYY